MLHHGAGLKLISAQPWDSFLVHGHMLPASSLCKQRDLGFYSSRCHVQKRCTRFPTTSIQLSTIKPSPLKAGTPSLVFAQLPSCPLLPQTTVGLFIGGEGAVADVPKGVARLQFGFLTV